MRNASNRPLESSSLNRSRTRHEQNFSTSRNSKKKAAGNPIAIPGQHPPLESVPVKLVARMKTSRESQLERSNFRPPSEINSNNTGLKRRTRNHSHDEPTTQSRNIPQVRTSPRNLHKRKEAEVIEINSDNEENISTSDVEEAARPKPRKRRLIKHDCENSDDEDDNHGYNNQQQDTEESQLDAHRLRVAEKLRVERQSKNARDEEERRNRAKSRERARLEESARQEEEQATEKPLSYIEKKKELTKAELKKLLYEDQDMKSDSKAEFIKPRRLKPSITPRYVFKEPFPQVVIPSLGDSVSKTAGVYDLNTTTSAFPSSSRKSSMQNLLAKIRNKRNNHNDDDDDYVDSKVSGSRYDFDDEVISMKPLVSKKSTKSKDKENHDLMEQEETVEKVELPYDPIDSEALQPLGHDGHLLTYPYEGKKSVTVHERDIDRLNEGEFLNDTLLDVFPKIWADEYPNASTHTFSSFFYTKLAGNGKNMDYEKIGRWTSNVNIFEKKLIIVPVAQHHHWYLVVVTNPGCCIKNAKAYGLTNAAAVQEEGDDSDPFDINTPARPGRKRRNVPLGAILNRKKPYIMILDSLGGTKSETSKNICEYLKKEAMQKLNIKDDEFLEPEFVSTFCPNQKNFVDCGVFCLHYINSLYQYPDDMMDVLYNNAKEDAGWDRENSLPNFRQILKRILKRKMREYRVYLLTSLDETKENENN